MPGLYNYDKTETADGYTWYQVEPNVWIAYMNSDVLYPALPALTEKPFSRAEMEALIEAIFDEAKGIFLAYFDSKKQPSNA